MQQPSGTVTFLFTDIEGSTRMWQAAPTEMAEAQATHDRILLGEVAARDGFVFSTGGDGIGAAFATPADALAAAVAAQEALQSTAWPEPTPVTVRMGLHTGHAEERDGDYFGHDVNLAARVMAAGHGGQVLLTATTLALLGPHPGPGTDALDLGEHRLKDIAEAVRLHQILRPGLRSSFPPLRSERAARGNLPAATAELIGREADVAAVMSALGTTRALTLLGPGGVGKTRLGLEVARRLAPAHQAGGWLVELAPIGDATLWYALAGELGVQERQGLGIDRAVLEWLGDRDTLLLLDNAEHVVDAVAEAVERILRHCPDTVVLLTSREALGIEGERVWRVPTLAVAPPAGAVGSDGPTTPAMSAAAALFVARARAVSTVDLEEPAVLGTIEAIVGQLDGLPLAIELAAAQTRALSPASIAERLDTRFRLLAGGRRGAEARHQTLRATVDWSYGLLTPEQQLAFDRLSVFLGGFDLEAAEAVVAGGAIHRDDVLPLLADLADKSMVSVHHDGEHTRYSLLETLRAYGTEQLVARGEADAVASAHTDAFVAVLEQIAEGGHSSDEARWRARFAIELDNLRAAFGRLLDTGDLERAARFPDRLIFGVGLDHAEVHSWPGQVVAASRAAGTPIPEGLFPSLIYGLATDGQFDRGEELAAEAAARDDLSPTARAAARSALAMVAFFQGDLERCVALCEEAGLDGYAHPRQRLYQCIVLPLALGYLGRPDEAQACLDRYRGMVEASGSPSGWAFYEYGAGEIRSETDPLEAIEHLERSLVQARAAQNRFIEGVALVTLASILGRHGRPRPALEAMRGAIVHLSETGNVPQFWTSVRNLIEVLCRQDHPEAAAVLLGAQDAARGASTLFGEGEQRLADARAQVAERLGPDAFAAALTRGAQLSALDAAAFAAGSIDLILAALPEE